MRTQIVWSLPAAILCFGLAAGAPAAPAAQFRSPMSVAGVPPAAARFAARIAARLAARGATPLGWSPQGQLLIATRFGETTQLHLLAAAGGARRQLTFLRNPVRGGAFSPDPWHDNFVFAKDRGGRDDYRLYLQSLGNPRAQALTDAKADARVAVWSNGGKRLAFAGTAADGRGEDITVMAPADPGAARVVVAGNGAYPAPLDWSPDDRRLLVRVTLADGGVELYSIDLTSGARRQIVPKGGRDAIPEARFSRDGRGVYLITARDAEYRELRYADLATGRESTVSTGAAGDVEEFALSRDGHYLAYTQDEGGADRLRITDLLAHRALALPPLPSPGLVDSLHFDLPGKRLAFAFDAPNHPRDAFVLDLVARRLEAWTHSEPGAILPAQIAAPRLTHFQTFDRVGGRPRQLPVYLYDPPGPGRHPVLILLHSGANGAFCPGFDPWIRFVVDDLGYAVVAPNLRGSSGGGKSSEALGEGRLRGDVLKDIGALLVWIEGRSDLNAKRVVVAGRSYGGYLALMAAVDYSARLSGAVDLGGMTDLPTYLDELRPARQAVARGKFGDEHDAGTREFLRDLSPLALADRITVPVLIVHGRNDPRVAVDQAQEMAALLRSHHDRVWLMIANREGHRFVRQTDRDAMYTAFAQFLISAR